MAYSTLKNLKKEIPSDFTKVDKKIIHDRLRPILKDFIKLANEAGVKVYLVYGSLLGYERHNGKMIPGDDDIDVCISYSDRPKMAKLLNKHNVYQQNETLDRPGPGLGHFRYDYDTLTDVYFSSGRVGKYAIDIFEVARFKNKNDYKKIKFALGLLFVRKSSGKGIQRLARGVLKLLPLKFYTNMLNKREKKYIDMNGAYEAVLIDDSDGAGKTSYIGSDNKVKFEGVDIYIPNNHTEILNTLYGNGEKVPSEKDINGNTHFFGERKIK